MAASYWGDKDAQGNFHIREFHHNYGYDLEKVLKQLPLKELQDKGQSDKLHEALKSGDSLAVSFVKDGWEQRYYIEANPQFRSVHNEL